MTGKLYWRIKKDDGKWTWIAAENSVITRHDGRMGRFLPFVTWGGNRQ